MSERERTNPVLTHLVSLVLVLLLSVGALIVSGIVGLLFMLNGRGLICPDGGDATWHKQPTAGFVIWAIIALLLVAGFWLPFRRSLTVGGVWRASQGGALLATTTAGSLSLLLIVYDWYANSVLPASYRCGDTYPTAYPPGPDNWLPWLLLTLYVVAVGWVFGRSAIHDLSEAG